MNDLSTSELVRYDHVEVEIHDQNPSHFSNEVNEGQSPPTASTNMDEDSPTTSESVNTQAIQLAKDNQEQQQSGPTPSNDQSLMVSGSQPIGAVRTDAMKAIKSPDIECLKKLINSNPMCIYPENDADEDEGQETLLYAAVEQDFYEAASLILDTAKRHLWPGMTDKDESLKKYVNWPPKDDEGCRALYLVANSEKDSEKMAKLLLEHKASCTEISNDETPAHAAISKGNIKVLRKLIHSDPQCMYCPDELDKWTVLHLAIDKDRLEAAELILNTAKEHLTSEESLKQYVNKRDKQEHTALHMVATGSGNVALAKLLFKYHAEVNPLCESKDTKSPFHLAVFYGRLDLALYLLDKGAMVGDRKAFQSIIKGGYEKIAKAVIEKSPHWPYVLRCKFKKRGKNTTPFRELITKMPDVAEMVLNRCIPERDPKKETDDHEDYREGKDYEVLFNYEFIEDYHDDSIACCEQTQTDYEESNNRQSLCLKCIPCSSIMNDSPKDDDNDKEKKIGCSFDEITDCEEYKFRKQWGPRVFTKANHPLQIMVKHNRMNLLNHPVVGSLVHHKWKTYGFWLYALNLIMYIIYLTFLTTFALVVPSPLSELCYNSMNGTIMMGGESSEIVCADEIQQGAIIGLSIVVFIFAIIRLFFELLQLLTQTTSCCFDFNHWPIEFGEWLPYVTDWVNWIELAQYICTIAFAGGIYTVRSNCYCAGDSLWQTGVAAVFMGWIVLVLFISKFPKFGIYVIILTRIIITYLEMLILMFLLVIAFGLTFYLIFFEFSIKRSPFFDPARALLKTTAMSLGELDFNDNFRFDPTGGGEDSEDVPFRAISYIVWIVFIFLMPVVLINMLTSLAVDDTEKIRSEAKLQNLALQIDMVLSVEEFYFAVIKYLFRFKMFKTCVRCLTRHGRGRIYYLKEKPNKEKSRIRALWNDFLFEFWGGCRYDRSDVILKAIDPPKEEVLENVAKVDEEVRKATKEVGELKTDMNEVKGMLSESEGRVLKKVTQVDGEVKKEVGELKTDINKVKEIQVEVNKEIGELKTNVNKVKETLSESKGVLEKVTQVDDEVKKEVGELKTDMNKVKGMLSKSEGVLGNVAQVDEEVKMVKKEVGELKTDMNEVKGMLSKSEGVLENVTELDEEVKKVKKEVGELKTDMNVVKEMLSEILQLVRSQEKKE